MGDRSSVRAVGDLLLRIGDRDVATMDDMYRFLNGRSANWSGHISAESSSESIRPSEAA
jgi:hypothetical protein